MLTHYSKGTKTINFDGQINNFVEVGFVARDQSIPICMKNPNLQNFEHTLNPKWKAIPCRRLWNT